MYNKLFSRIKQSLSDLLLVHASMPTTYQIKKWMLENDLLCDNNIKGTTSLKYTDHDIIVSLTTHRPRLHFVHLAIASIMRQTMKANRIILWIDASISIDELPEFIKKLIGYGLEIRQCEDIRSYKKLVPAIKDFPNDAIITIDDDVIYEPDTLERLIKAHCSHPNVIFGNRCSKISRDADGKRKPYNEWEQATMCSTISSDIVPIGVEGVIYPPHIFSKEVLNSDIFLRYCPTADDIWFKFMSKLNNVDSGLSQPRNLQTRLITDIPEAIHSSLFNVNRIENDRQIKLLEDYYRIKL